jgi:hypothetical protein
MIQVLKQLAKILPANSVAKKQFAESRGLQKILIKRNETGLKSNPEGRTIETIIEDICKIYPPDLVNYFTPNFEEKIAMKLDKYNQQQDG